MQCPECQWQNSPEQKFCAKCGLFLLEPQTGYHLASYGRRAGAYLLDSLLFYITLVIGYLVWSIIVMARGQSPGKQLLGMYVINDRGERIGFWHYALLRTFIGWGLLGAVTLGIYNLLDLVWPLWNRHNQALHDKVAGTFVVRRTVQE